MKLKPILHALPVLLACCWSVASAQEHRQGYYLSGALGIAADFHELEVESPVLGPGSDIDLQLGWSAIGGAVGYSFGNGWRMEGSLGYSDTDIASARTSVGQAATGRVRNIELMANGYYDFLPGRRLQPYVGLGVGVIRTSFEDALFVSIPPVTLDDTSEWNPAAQGILGLGWNFSDTMTATLEYRYLTAANGSDLVLSDGSPLDVTYGIHRILLGLRYHF